MKIKLLFLGLWLAFFSMNLAAQNTAAEQQINELLTEFLQKVDKKEMHDRFWAEDLIYTSSGGERFGKATIMSGFEGSDDESDQASIVTYSAENVEIRIFGKTAALAFTLVAHSDGTKAKYLNSGTLVKRKGEWVVVQWQATKAKE